MSKKILGRKTVLLDAAFTIGVFCLCFATLCLLNKSMTWEYCKELISRAAVLSIITLGAVFVFTIGAFGISLGASTLMGISFGALVYDRSNSLLLAFLGCVGAPVLGCVISSLLSSFFNLPSYVTAALMLGFFGSVARLVLHLNGGEIVTGLCEFSRFNSTGARLLFSVLFLGLCVLLYHILPIGRRQKELGDNKDRARLSGLSRRSLSLVGFLVAGIGVGLGGFLILCSYPSVSRASVSDLGFNIIFAIVLGGMSFSGGSRSRLSSAIWGSFSAIFLSEIIYTAWGDSPVFLGLSQALRGIILIALMTVLLLREKKYSLKWR